MHQYPGLFSSNYMTRYASKFLTFSVLYPDSVGRRKRGTVTNASANSHIWADGLNTLICRQNLDKHLFIGRFDWVAFCQLLAALLSTKKPEKSNYDMKLAGMVFQETRNS